MIRRALAISIPVGYYLSTRKFGNSRVNANTLNTQLVSHSLQIEEFQTAQDTCAVKLFGYNGCPYRGKVQAFLEYHGFDFEQVEINPFTKSELKKFVPNYKKSPCVLVTGPNGQTLVLKDSAIIITVLEKLAKTEPNDFATVAAFTNEISGAFFELSDKEKKALTVEELAPLTQMIFNKDPDRLFVDDKLLHTVAPNIYENHFTSRVNLHIYQAQSPKYRDTWSGWAIAEISAPIMWLIGGMVFKKYREHEDQTPRQYLYSACDQFIARKGEDRFLGGDWPNTADLEAYGLFTTFNGTEVMDDLRDHKPIFFQWFTSVQALVQSHHGRI